MKRSKESSGFLESIFQLVGVTTIFIGVVLAIGYLIDGAYQAHKHDEVLRTFCESTFHPSEGLEYKRYIACKNF